MVKDGWRITDQVDNPLGLQAPERSLGVALTDGENERWMLLTLERSTGAGGDAALVPSASADDAGKAYARLDDWLDLMVDLHQGIPSGEGQGGQGGGPSNRFVVEDGAGELVAASGTTLLEQRPAPVIDGYTRDGDRLAKVERNGRTWFLVVRGSGRGMQVIQVDPAVLSAPTFDALIDHVSAQADSGEGLL